MEGYISVDLVRKKMLQRNYSPRTIVVYLAAIEGFVKYCLRNHLNAEKDIQAYLLHLVAQGYSTSYQNQVINAVKFYWEKILEFEPSRIEIDRPMKEKKLPEVLSQEEVRRILAQCKNPKQLLALKLIYACGLRVSEVVNLQIKDIESTHLLIRIRQGKGKKDRLVPLPESLLEEMRTYYKVFRPNQYLLEGQSSTAQFPVAYSSRSVQAVVKRCAKKAGIWRVVTPHTLRHSYATHLYEHGVNLRSIQMLLGHNSSKTTEIYTHVSRVHLQHLPSPIDFL